MLKRIKIRSNGLTFLYDQNQSAGSVTAALFFKSGVIYEKERELGVSRFVQELLFRQYASGFSADLLTEQSAGRDHAAFLFTAPPECAGEAVERLLRVFDEEPFGPAQIETVRSDMIRAAQTWKPSPEETQEALLFDRPQYAASPFGTERSLFSLTEDKLRQWRNAYFAPSNACLVVTGAVSNDDLNAVTALLRSLPARKRKTINTKQLFPADQFFRTSASDRLLPTEEPFASVSLQFEIDLGETKPVWADLLRRLLTEPPEGAVHTALTGRKLTDAVDGGLRLYRGFATLSLSCFTFHANAAECALLMAESAAEFKEKLREETVAPLLKDYAVNRLYRTDDNAHYAYDVGLHNFILFTDDLLLPEDISAEAATEALLTAADLILLPDNAVFTLYYNEKRGADPAAIKKRLAAARIRLFL